MLFLASSFCFFFSFTPESTAAPAGQQKEKLTITTYYPAPTGVYVNLRLSPTNQPTVGVDRGMMYYNTTENKIKYYNGIAWLDFGGGGNGFWNEDSDHYIFNNNPGARVRITGTGADNDEILWVEGDMRVYDKSPIGDGNSLIYMTRLNSTATGTMGFETADGSDPGYGIIHWGNPQRLSIQMGPPSWYRTLTVANDKVGMGIGWDIPQQRLEVSASLRLTPTTTVPANSEGSIYYNNTTKTLQYRDNSTWNSFISEYGNVTIPAGCDTYTVPFRKAYANPPIVIATPTGEEDDHVLVRNYQLTSTQVVFDMDVFEGDGSFENSSTYDQEIRYIVIPR